MQHARRHLKRANVDAKRPVQRTLSAAHGEPVPKGFTLEEHSSFLGAWRNFMSSERLSKFNENNPRPGVNVDTRKLDAFIKAAGDNFASKKGRQWLEARLPVMGIKLDGIKAELEAIARGQIKKGKKAKEIRASTEYAEKLRERRGMEKRITMVEEFLKRPPKPKYPSLYSGVPVNSSK